MREKLRFLGLDVHAETISVAVAEPDVSIIESAVFLWFIRIGTVCKIAVIPSKFLRAVRKLNDLGARPQPGRLPWDRTSVLTPSRRKLHS